MVLDLTMSSVIKPDTIINLDEVRIDPAIALRVPESLAMRRRALAFGEDDAGVYAACLDPEDAVTVEALERAVGRKVIALRAVPESLDRALGRVFIQRDTVVTDETVRLVDDIMNSALLEGASDIHIEPSADGARVRYRVDGTLEAARQIAPDSVPGLVNRLKVLSGMDIAEKRVAQDGRFTYSTGPASGGRAVDVRAAALPTKFGERVTLRLLSKQVETLTLTRLGLLPRDLATFQSAIQAPHGLILLTGPTGSGKTTSLYAALRALDLPRLNVLTIEDPVEYDIPGVSQVEVDTGDRITFAKALRSALRHDPDVLMIGEIRDLETAEVAVRASLTGHLVVSTLHTNSAVSAVTRLADMGLPRYLIANTLRLAMAQRLVRRLCKHCVRERPLGASEAAALGDRSFQGRMVGEAVGCAFCKRSGYAGRIGLFETFAPGPEAAAAITDGMSEKELFRISGNARTLRDDAIEKVFARITPPTEAIEAVEGA